MSNVGFDSVVILPFYYQCTEPSGLMRSTDSCRLAVFINLSNSLDFCHITERGVHNFKEISITFSSIVTAWYMVTKGVEPRNCELNGHVSLRFGWAQNICAT